MILPFLAAATMVLQVAERPGDASAQSADLRCLAVYAAAADDQTDEKQLRGVFGALMYYVGRIDARDPGYDIQGGLVRLLNSPDYAARYPADVQRCTAEIATRGNAISAIGKALQEAVPSGGTRPR